MSHKARSWVAALGGLIVGVVLIWISAEVRNSSPRLSIFLQHVGSFIIASVVIGLIFQFWQMRGLLEDMWEEHDIVKSLRTAKLSRFDLEFEEADISWAQYFRDSDRVNLMFAYASTWRGRHRRQLRRFVEDRGSNLSVILPDPQDEFLMRTFARRFEQLEPQGVRDRVIAAQDYFRDLGDRGEADVKIYALARPMVFSFYQFNTDVVMATYRHRAERGVVITMVGERGGKLYKFLQDEWNWLVHQGVEEGVTRIVYPPGG